MTMSPIKSPWILRYMDPAYAEMATMAEQKFGLPSGILDAIRTRGERSNADQVSSAGARTPYQFIPATRRGMMNNYGVDPWKDPQSATTAAAQLLAENYKRTGDWDQSVRMYHGGTDRHNWGPQNNAYAARVGSFGKGQGMPQRSLYNGPDIEGSFDPHWVDPTANTEPRTEPVPVPGSAGPSQSVPAGSQLAHRKRRGLLGSIGHILGQVFMPEPDSLYAAALRGGIYDAKANQAKYKAEAEHEAILNEMDRAKLKNYITKGEYQIAGNNVVHFPADGGDAQIIAPPATPSEKERLIDAWRREADPEVKTLMERMLLGASSDEVLQNRADVARTRAGATTGAAQIRANSSGTSTQYEYKMIDGKLMRRRK